MRITFLGTGTSHGVPMIGCRCRVCRSRDPRDRRTRSAAAIRSGDVCWVIDTPPEFRLQCLECGIERVDGVLLTHAHADHIFGLDDVRRFNELQRRPIPLFGDADTLAVIRTAFAYCFDEPHRGLTRPRVEPRVVDGEFDAPPFRVRSFALPHGPAVTLGYLFEAPDGRRAAYCTDCSDVPDAVIDAVRGCDLLVLDALRDRPHPSHMTVEQAVEIGRRCAAGRVYLTHLCHDLAHRDVEERLPPGFFVAYDGLSIDLPCGDPSVT